MPGPWSSSVSTAAFLYHHHSDDSGLHALSLILSLLVYYMYSARRGFGLYSCDM